jgi:methylenetetrahydrofolate dehydrogenase (NADP+)/methenyltetrahydrofolate cyclohydrolase
MSARTLDGQALARTIQEEIRPEVAAFTAQHGRPPGLGIVLVGENPASEVYVRNKLKAGSEIGFRADLERLPASATLADMLALVERLNRSAAHDGILVQSPLPKAMGADAEHRERIQIAGRHAVVIGRSDIVGKPVALLLMHRDATVTVCHSRTQNLAEECRRADILVAAVGKAGLITREFVKPGAAVIDVGMNRVIDAAVVQSLFAEGHPRLDIFRAKGSILVGDVHPTVSEVAGALTPVPGGVGPLTVTMLMRNTLRAARARTGQPVG